MIEDAKKRSPSIQVHRTKTSNFDTIFGVIGEYCFAQWLFGEWESHSKLDTKGQADFFNRIEVKTSAFPFSEKLNLLVREDYAKKRKPDFYVQTIIDLPKRYVQELPEDLKCILAGYATAEEIDNAPLKDFGSKYGGPGGYKCRYIPISELKPIDNLRTQIKIS
jgi:hypothetical protein